MKDNKEKLVQSDHCITSHKSWCDCQKLWRFCYYFCICLVVLLALIVGALFPLYFLNNPATKSIDPSKCNISDILRIDCYKEKFATPDKCKARGCCWTPAASSANGIPRCFYSMEVSSYNMSQPQSTLFGYTATLKRNGSSHWPDDIMTLQMGVLLETDKRVHIKILDPKNKRYEVPIETPKISSKANSTEYSISFQEVPAGLTISRSSMGSKLFDTTKHPLTFADQYIEISSSLPSRYLYGLGEHRGHGGRLWLDGLEDQKRSLWAGKKPPREGVNLYGTHPFFIGLEEDGNAYGVFLLNSNAMDVIISNQVITYRTIGGILDFYVFMGPTPDDVISQYTAVIGRPILPPYWALGFHLCRWDYTDDNNLRKVIKRMRDGKFPYDTQWSDIDYMYKHLDWTYDNKTYKNLPKIVEDLHNHTQHYVMIVDPGIHNLSGYRPYDLGLQKDIFIKMADGSGPIIGRVWPGTTVFPDFSNPASYDYWYDSASRYHKQVLYDGIWLDMNEPSNFVHGSMEGCVSKNKYDDPPYVPGVNGEDLKYKTLCPSSLQHISNHYNLHSLYGHFEMVQTNRVLTTLRKKRPFIVSRSTFAGSGRYGFHWLGDNSADWINIYYSIPAILNFNMFGIPFVGADVCGFNGNTTAELCTRWTQLGAFYPFMRNHNCHRMEDQDPAYPGFPKAAQDAMRKALNLRYTLLPTLYSLLHKSRINGMGVARPLFFQYPKDAKTYTLDRQFLWGDALMISPVLIKDARFVEAYFPKDTWYDFISGEKIEGEGKNVELSAPMDKINVHMRGGSIVVTQVANVTTTLSRKNPFGIVAAMPDTDKPFSFMWYWDDGDSIYDCTTGESGCDTNAFCENAGGKVACVCKPSSAGDGSITCKAPNDKKIGNLISITARKIKSGGSIQGTVLERNYDTSMVLGTVQIFGVDTKPKLVNINGKSHLKFTYDTENKVLFIKAINLEVSENNFVLDWQ